MTTFYDLNPPSDSDLARSKALSRLICEMISKQGTYIPFSQFMEAALYQPTLGYYQAGNIGIGKTGDFTTAPEISPLYAHCLAMQCQEIMQHAGLDCLLELGAGSGQMASDLISKLQALNCQPEYYFIYEKSEPLRKQQQEKLRAQLPDFISRIHWIDTLPVDFTGIILANEVLDALAVHCFQIESGAVMERCVSWENEQFQWKLTPPSSPALKQLASKIQNDYDLPEGYASEINLALAPFIQALSQCLYKGVILLADYGYGQEEYYHPERCHGTLTCFYKHHRHDNPLAMPGLQDITSHVDFTHVAEVAVASNMSLLGFTTQAAFLLGCGLLGMAAEIESRLDTIQQFALHQAIKTLTLPTEMGERIKIMGLAKELELPPLMGFGLQDRRRDL